jgi:aldose sugar dehydrogenase
MTRTKSFGRLMASTFLAAALALGPIRAAQAETPAYEIETVAEGLEHPWGMAFLPGDGRLLVTERPGRLQLVDRDNGAMQEIGGVPDVVARGQGGLLDVALHPDFGDEPWVYLSWAGGDAEGRAATHVGRGLLDLDALALTEFEVLFVAEPFMDPGQGHYGARLAFDGENRLFVTLGDRQQKDFGPDHIAQDLSSAYGSTLRLEADGGVPDDNPFVDEPDAVAAIWSYGHRNSQGMAFHPETGELWQNEHGENNGDEINVIERGGNYGWPIAHYGVGYRTGEVFAPAPPEVPETVDPVHWWDADDPEGFPPSGFAFYDGDAFPDWQGNAFMGNLAHEYLGRFTIDGREVEMTERLLEGEGWRIRDVAVGPDDGYLYVLVDDSSVPLIRLRPAEGS